MGQPARPAVLVVAVLAGTLTCCAGVPPLVTTPTPEPKPDVGGPRWHIELEAGDDVDVGHVVTRLCFAGPAPPRVGPEYGAALAHLSGPPRATDSDGQVVGLPLPVVDDGRDAGIDTSALPPGACVAFSVDVEAAAKSIHQRDVAEVLGRSLLISPDVWLWRPKPWPAGGANGTLTVDKPGLVAAPFAVDDAGDFIVPSRTFALQSYGALGRFSSRTQRSRRGAAFDIVRLGSLADGVDDDTLGAWIDVAIDDVAVPLRQFPATRLMIVVVPSSGSRPVLGGFLGRGGGPSALLLVGQGPMAVDDDPEMIDDQGRWVLTHELAHALLPPVVRSDAWFNEGLTTWHQEVLPAAAGRRPRDIAEAQLRVGLRTGAARSRHDGLSLERACREMDARGSYQHCYWGGAALMVLLAREVGDNGVFALVRAIHAQGPVDAVPQPAAALLARAAETAAEPVARRAARTLLRLWRRHRDGLFPAVDAPATDAGPVWPGHL